MLLMKKWADACGLTMKQKVTKYSSNNGTAIKIIGTTSISMLLALTLGVDMANVTVCLGDFYLGFLGCDVLYGQNKALGLATTTLPR